MKKTEPPIIVEQIFDTSIETVWSAITDIEKMHQWYFPNIPSFKPEVGFETQFNIKNEDRDFLHIWRVTEVVPQKMITCHWEFDGYPGEADVTFELFEQNDQTLLRLTNRVIEDFPDEIPEFRRESGLEGWKFFITKSLRDFLMP